MSGAIPPHPLGPFTAVTCTGACSDVDGSEPPRGITVPKQVGGFRSFSCHPPAHCLLSSFFLAVALFCFVGLGFRVRSLLGFWFLFLFGVTRRSRHLWLGVSGCSEVGGTLGSPIAGTGPLGALGFGWHCVLVVVCSVLFLVCLCVSLSVCRVGCCVCLSALCLFVCLLSVFV